VKTLIKERSTALVFTAWGVEAAELTSTTSLEHVASWCAARDIMYVQFWVGHPPMNIEELLSKDIAYEGLVYKTGNLSGYRKWKPVLTVDAVVTAIVPGKGKYAGMVGALEVSVYDDMCAMRVIATTGGFTDEERAGLSADVIGTVVEIAYQYVGSKGRLRHPRFIRFRDDKLAEQCTLDQLDNVQSSSSVSRADHTDT
jgi:ATP-dependent DNA ligase